LTKNQTLCGISENKLSVSDFNIFISKSVLRLLSHILILFEPGSERV